MLNISFTLKAIKFHPHLKLFSEQDLKVSIYWPQGLHHQLTYCSHFFVIFPWVKRFADIKILTTTFLKTVSRHALSILQVSLLWLIRYSLELINSALTSYLKLQWYIQSYYLLSINFTLHTTDVPKLWYPRPGLSWTSDQPSVNEPLLQVIINSLFGDGEARTLCTSLSSNTGTMMTNHLMNKYDNFAEL